MLVSSLRLVTRIELRRSCRISGWIRNNLTARPHVSTWRTRPAYAQIFQSAVGPGATGSVASLLADAGRDQNTIRTQMFTLADPFA